MTTTTKPARVLVRRAVLQALHDELESDPDVIVMGEDIAVAGGAFKCTEGLLDTFGPTRVIDTPISEMGFLGAAVGAAATGLKPVVEMMFIEFIGVALDQLTTEATGSATSPAVKSPVPLVVRASAGAGLGFGCQHSQMLDYWFRGVGGLKVCRCPNAQNAYGLLRAAIRDPDPVVVLEPRPVRRASGAGRRRGGNRRARRGESGLARRRRHDRHRRSDGRRRPRGGRR